MDNDSFFKFLEDKTLSGEAGKLRDSFMLCSEVIANNMKEREELIKTLQNKEAEYLKLQGELIGYRKLIESLSAKKLPEKKQKKSASKS